MWRCLCLCQWILSFSKQAGCTQTASKNMQAPAECSEVLGSALLGTGQHCASQHLSLLRISNHTPLPGPWLTYYHKCCPNPPSRECPNRLDMPKDRMLSREIPLLCHSGFTWNIVSSSGILCLSWSTRKTWTCHTNSWGGQQEWCQE